MAAYLGPLLLALVGIGGVVVIVGRRLSVLRQSLQELPMPASARVDAHARRRARATSSVVHGSVRVVRAVGKVLGVLGRALGRVLRRPPVAFRVPRLALRPPSGRPSFLPRFRESARSTITHAGGVPLGFASRIRRGAPGSEGRAPSAAVPSEPSFDIEPPAPPQVTQQALAHRDHGEARARLWRHRRAARAETSEMVPAPRSLGEVGPPAASADTHMSEEGVPEDAQPRAAVSAVPDDAQAAFPARSSEAKPADVVAPIELTLTEVVVQPALSKEQAPGASLGHPYGSRSVAAGPHPDGSDPQGTPALRIREAKPAGTPPLVSAQPGARVRDRRTGKRKVVGRVVRKKPDVRNPESVAAEGRSPDGRVSVAGLKTAGSAGADMRSVALPEEGQADDAFALFTKGEFARAENVLVDRLTGNPRDLDAYRLLGILYIERGDFPQAREVLEEALRRHPTEASLCGPLGRAYMGASQYSKALRMYQQAHNADERNLEYLEQLLRIAGRMDRRPLVRVTAEKILALQPDHAEATKHLARVTTR